MATREELSLENQLIEARKEYKRRVDNGLSYQKKQLAEVERLEAKITEQTKARMKAIDDSVKSAKIYAKLTSDAEKSEASLDKSLSSRLSNLVKGNVAGFIFVINLFDLGGCDKLKKSNYQVENLIEFPGH